MSLRFIELKEVRYVSLRYDQHMEIGNWETIIDPETQLVLQSDVASFLSSAEGTGVVTMVIGLAQRPKVSGVFVPLHRVTAVTEGLEIG